MGIQQLENQAVAYSNNPSNIDQIGVRDLVFSRSVFNVCDECPVMSTFTDDGRCVPVGSDMSITAKCADGKGILFNGKCLCT